MGTIIIIEVLVRKLPCGTASYTHKNKTDNVRLWLVCRQLVFAHRQALAEQLHGESEAAMALHLAVVILFQTLTQTMVHVPGRLVPAVLAHLQELMDEEPYATLTRFQGMCVVTSVLMGGGGGVGADLGACS